MATYESLEAIYAWVDEIPLSRCKKNLTRDFSDGDLYFPVLMAELCKHCFPKIVDLHNYPPANSHAAKVINWETLNRKVFNKLQIRVTEDLIQQIATCVPGALESVLIAIKQKADIKQKQISSCRVFSRNGDCGDQKCSDSLISDIGVLAEIRKLKSEVQLKNDVINTLNQKVSHLENMLEMKDQRLKELSASVDRLQARESQDSFRTTSA